jgi:hypothetical protein
MMGGRAALVNADRASPQKAPLQRVNVKQDGNMVGEAEKFRATSGLLQKKAGLRRARLKVLAT